MTNVDAVTALLALWDTGQPVWTIELGGLGPGYEQAIQIAAIEMARDNISVELPQDTTERSTEWRRLCSNTLSRIDDDLLGLSGAQFNAAMWLAFQWCHGEGPENLVERARKADRNRAIMVSRHWPKAPAAPTTPRTAQ